MATKLYISTSAPGYTPASNRGAWDTVAGIVTKALVDSLDPDLVTMASIAIAETNVNVDYDVLLAKTISRPIAADVTIDGTLTVILGIKESAIAADDYWHIHAYVTQGDSDTPRGTLITDFIGASEFPTTAAGLTTGAIAVDGAGVAALTGDRIVVEIGYQAKNTVTTSYTGTLNYGNVNGAADLPNGDTAVTTKNGTLTFSKDITFTTPKRRVTAAWSEIDLTAGANAKRRVTAAWAEVELTALANAKRRVTAVWVEVDIGIVLPYDFVSANIC